MARATMLISRLATLVLPLVALVSALMGSKACTLVAIMVIILPFTLLVISTVEHPDRLTILAAIAVFIEIVALVYLRTGL